MKAKKLARNLFELFILFFVYDHVPLVALFFWLFVFVWSFSLSILFFLGILSFHTMSDETADLMDGLSDFVDFLHEAALKLIDFLSLLFRGKQGLEELKSKDVESDIKAEEFVSSMDDRKMMEFSWLLLGTAALFAFLSYGKVISHARQFIALITIG